MTLATPAHGSSRQSANRMRAGTLAPLMRPVTTLARQSTAADAVRPRPADVVRAIPRFRPSSGTLGAADAMRARELVAAALAELPAPAIVTSRHAADAERILREGEFSTIFHNPLPDDPRVPREVEMRRAAQLKDDIYGVGDDAGRTVFGAVQFPRRSSSGEPDVRGRTSVGLTAKGQVAFVFRPEALARATFSAADAVSGASSHGAAEQITEIALERVLRDYRIVEDSSQPIFPDMERRLHSAAPDRPAAVAELRERFLTLIHGPDRVAIDAFKRELASPPAFKPGPYYAPPFIQAELRNPSLADVERIYIDGVDPGVPWSQPTPTEQQQRLETLAAQRGIPLENLQRATS